MEKSPNNPESYDLEELERQLAGPVRGVQFMEGEPRSERAWAKVERDTAFVAGKGNRFSHKSFRRRLVYTAATLILISTFSHFWKQLSHPSIPSQSRQYSTARGQVAMLQLEDGTHVVLGPASVLQYTRTSGGRAAELVGIAYFDVVHDGTKPFIVRAGTAVTRVLGTSFQVRKYDRDTAAVVVVSSGRVALNNTILNVGDVGRTEYSGVNVTHDARPAGLLGWTQGKIVFNDIPLSDALAELSLWFNTDFRLADESLASQRVTSTYTNRSADDVASILAAAISARVVRSGNTITFYPITRGR